MPEFGDVLHSFVHAGSQTFCCTTMFACIAGNAPTLIDGEISSAYKELNLTFSKTGLSYVAKVTRETSQLRKRNNWH